MLRVVRADQGVRLEAASCPLDPLILSIVSRNRQLLPYDSVSKSTLGLHIPPIVATLGPDSADFVQFWSKFGPDSAHFVQFWSNLVPIVPTLLNLGADSAHVAQVWPDFGCDNVHFAQCWYKSTSDSAHVAQFWPTSTFG